MPVSEKIAQIRRQRGMTQETLGDALGVTAQAVSKWEVGSALPDVSLLPRLCEVLDVPPDDLLELPPDTRFRFIKASVTACASDLLDRGGVETTSLLLDLTGRLFDASGCNYGGNALRMGQGFLRLRLQGATTDKPGGKSSPDEAAFLLCGKKMEADYLSTDPAALDGFLNLFRNARAFAVLRETDRFEALSSGELAERTGIPREELKSVLIDLVEMNILEVRLDTAGKRGYMRGPGFAAVIMVLAAADACGCLSGPGINAVWTE